MLKILDFYADWCGPCKRQATVLEDLENQYGTDVLTIEKIDVESETDLAKTHAVTSIPTLVIMRDDEIIKRLVGLQSKATLISIIDENK